MEISGERECTDCGVRWSYYKTGAVACPDCGSLRSVGVDDPATHTAGTTTLDLSPVRDQLEHQPLRAVADEAADAAAGYLRDAGFVHAGELQPLGDSYLAAAELRRVATTLGRVMDISDAEQLHLLTLLRGADSGDRPPPEAVPETLFPERGLAVAAGVDAYLSDLRKLRGRAEHEDPPLDRVVSTVRARQKRLEALDGDVDPADAERLVRAVRDLGAYWRAEDTTALARASRRFD